MEDPNKNTALGFGYAHAYKTYEGGPCTRCGKNENEKKNENVPVKDFDEKVRLVTDVHGRRLELKPDAVISKCVDENCSICPVQV